MAVADDDGCVRGIRHQRQQVQMLLLRFLARTALGDVSRNLQDMGHLPLLIQYRRIGGLQPAAAAIATQTLHHTRIGASCTQQIPSRLVFGAAQQALGAEAAVLAAQSLLACQAHQLQIVGIGMEQSAVQRKFRQCHDTIQGLQLRPRPWMGRLFVISLSHHCSLAVSPFADRQQLGRYVKRRNLHLH